MADNISITAGSGTTIGSDDVGGIQYQQVKLMDPTLDSAEPIATGQSEVTTNTLRVVHVTDVAQSVYVTGSSGTTAVVGDVPSDLADNGSAPIKMGGIASITNPSTRQDGDRVAARFDKVGRQLVTPYQVRDLVRTAFVSITNGTETTLLASSAGKTFDLVWVSASTNSTWPVSGPTSSSLQGSVFVDIRCTTAGNIVTSLTLPPSDRGNLTFNPVIPWPQDATGNNWTVDMNDITGTTANISAIFIENV
jgi:hypothetical protein